MATLAEEWKTAKQAFTTATGQKKPTVKVLGVFNKSTGIEGSLKDVATALQKNDIKAYAKAKSDFAKAAADYIVLLDKTIVAEKGDEAAKKLFRAECGKLGTALNRIKQKVDQTVINVATDMSLEEAFGKDNSGKFANSIAGHAAVTALVNSAEFGKNGATGAVDPGLTQLQARMKTKQQV